MAIERMKKVTLVCRAGVSHRLLKALHELGVVELTDAATELGDQAAGALSRTAAATSDARSHLRKISHCLSVIDEFVPEKKTLLENVTPLPLVIEEDELERYVTSFNLDPIYTELCLLEEEFRIAERAYAAAEAKLAELEPFAQLPYSLADLKSTKRIKFVIGEIPAAAILELAADPELSPRFAAEVVPQPARMRKDAEGGTSLADLKPEPEPVRIAIAMLAEHEQQVLDALAKRGFQEMPLPFVPGYVRDRIRELQGDRDAARDQKESVVLRFQHFDQHRRPLRVLQAFWNSNLTREKAIELGVTGRWSYVLTGFIREIDIPRLEQMLAREFPDTQVIVADPDPADAVPVSIQLSEGVRPIEMLVNLFGLPKYQTFDPSPFIFLNFYLFFGICFGDVGYGLMLTALGAFLARHTRDYRGVNNFARIFVYAGISTTFFGAIMGSWLGDLWKPEFLGEGNLLLRLKETFMVLDPLADPVTALVIALGIGMVSQLYGVGLKMYGAIRARDWAAAVFDSLFWIIALPGLVILLSGAFAPVPPAVTTTGLILFLGGAAGLVLTQGRNEPTLAGKIITGIVSLYGILGTYGCTAFIGDVLSYCRLLALGLTTGIVASSFNMMAGMLKDIPYIGIPLFVIALIAGHVFNFLISVLGAFVHSMRLIFVEMFGRFYEPGGKAFAPLGFNTKHAILRRTQQDRATAVPIH